MLPWACWSDMVDRLARHTEVWRTLPSAPRRLGRGPNSAAEHGRSPACGCHRAPRRAQAPTRTVVRSWCGTSKRAAWSWGSADLAPRGVPGSHTEACRRCVPTAPVAPKSRRSRRSGGTVHSGVCCQTGSSDLHCFCVAVAASGSRKSARRRPLRRGARIKPREVWPPGLPPEGGGPVQTGSVSPLRVRRPLGPGPRRAEQARRYSVGRSLRSAARFPEGHLARLPASRETNPMRQGWAPANATEATYDWTPPKRHPPGDHRSGLQLEPEPGNHRGGHRFRQREAEAALGRGHPTVGRSRQLGVHEDKNHVRFSRQRTFPKTRSLR
jgi:hypothetical protein